MMKVTDMTNDIVIHDATQQRWLYFHCPKRIISAHRIEEVIPAMKAVEEMVCVDGLYAAGFIAYDAAPAFDPALMVRKDDIFPLIWFGLYNRPEHFPLPPAVEPYPESQSWVPSMTPDAYQYAIDRIKKYIEAGIPSREKLRELCLGYVVKDMETFWWKPRTG